jgi:twinkle protein
MDSTSEFVRHEPCPSCGSSDANGRYTDGHSYCFSCGHHEQGTANRQRRTVAGKRLVDGEYGALPKRAISEETCKHLDYMKGTYNDQPVQIANYYNAKGERCAQKLRFPNKDFVFLGDTKNAVLWGQTRWGEGNRRVIICEGEIDALSVDEVLGRRWPVVSVKNGASGAAKDLEKSIEWLESFEEIVLFFDQDEPGQKAAQECAALFAPGKVKIVSGFAWKDANEALLEGHRDEIVRAQYNARVYWPDDIVRGDDESIWDDILKGDKEADYQYPWKKLNEMTCGLRLGEVVLVTAGTGIGKSQMLREVVADARAKVRAKGKKIGLICLEESTKRTMLGLMSIELNCPLHLPPSHRKFDPTMEQKRKAFEEIGQDVLVVRHWGSLDSQRLFSKMRQLHAAGCEIIILDHISIVVSGSDEAEEGGGERRVLDKLMTRMRSLVEERQFSCIVVSHLRKPNGKSHELGGVPTLDDLRGSGALKQVPDIIWAGSRDQQADTEEERRITSLHVLKNRFAGETGPAGWLRWEPDTCRLREVDSDPFAEMEPGAPSEGAEGEF